MVPNETQENKEAVNATCLQYMIVCAQWNKDCLFGPILTLARLLDKVKKFSDLESVFPALAHTEFVRLPLQDRRYSLLPDTDLAYCGKHLHVKLGPVKDASSSLRKTLAYYDNNSKLDDYRGPACRYLTDMVRLTVAAADPYYIYLFYVLLRLVLRLTVVRTKNKHIPGKLESSGSPSILINVEIEVPDGPPFICEIQLYVRASHSTSRRVEIRTTFCLYKSIIFIWFIDNEALFLSMWANPTKRRDILS